MHVHDKRNESRTETRGRLIAAAADEFARHGYANARIRHIVDQAHANLAAVNYHFGGKDGLYRATLAALAAQSRPVRAPAERGRGPEERLRRRVQRMLERFLLQQEGAALGRILAHEALNPTEHLEQVIGETLRPELHSLARFLAEVSGHDADSEHIRFAALGVLGQCVLFQFAGAALHRASPGLPRGNALLQAASSHIAENTLAGLSRTPAGHFTCKAPERVL